MTKKISESLFTAILYVFSSAMLILSLLMSIKYTAVNDNANGIREQMKKLKEENALLLAEYESQTSLEKITEYAESVGMVRAADGQIEYLILSQITD